MPAIKRQANSNYCSTMERMRVAPQRNPHLDISHFCDLRGSPCCYSRPFFAPAFVVRARAGLCVRAKTRTSNERLIISFISPTCVGIIVVTVRNNARQSSAIIYLFSRHTKHFSSHGMIHMVCFAVRVITTLSFPRQGRLNKQYHFYSSLSSIHRSST